MAVMLEGMEQLMNQLQQLGMSVDTVVTEKALQAGGEVIKEGIKETAPVRSGHLENNIIVSDVKDGEIAIGPDQQGVAFYGHFLEFGTSTMDAKPFMRPGFENKKNQAQTEMGEVIKRELNL